MEQPEIEVAVGELETRMDRLRALYDQYFMGIEKLEPLVPRKDVERRMALLRKEQIRNTGLRYKFNMLIQRFNTNQTHWIRISRQIENGTYRRDVMRAKARFGVDPTKEGLGEPIVERPREPAAVATRNGAPSSSQEGIPIPQGLLDELEDGSAYLEEVDFDEDPFGALEASVPAEELPIPRERFASSLRLDIEALGEPLQEDDPFPKPAPPSAPQIRARAIAAPPPSSAAGPSSPGAPTIQKRGTLPGPVPAGAPVIAKRRDVATLNSTNSPLLAEVQRRMTLQGPGPAPAASVERPASPPGASPSAPAVRRKDAPTLTSGTSPIFSEVQRRMTLPDGAPPPGPSVEKPPVIIGAPPDAMPAAAPRVVQRPPTLSGGAIPSVAGPRVVQRPPTLSGGAIPSVQRAPVTPPRSTGPTAAAPAPARVGDLSGDRVDQIYSKYVETRRSQNEPTHAITREALAKQLSDSTERLKQKHGGKPIDFEVVVKDGKTILRPVVK